MRRLTRIFRSASAMHSPRIHSANDDHHDDGDGDDNDRFTQTHAAIKPANYQTHNISIRMQCSGYALRIAVVVALADSSANSINSIRRIERIQVSQTVAGFCAVSFMTRSNGWPPSWFWLGVAWHTVSCRVLCIVHPSAQASAIALIK